MYQTSQVSETPGYSLPPLKKTLQKYIIYETRSKLYIVGSNKQQTTFQILKIDRGQEDLNISVDRGSYDSDEVGSLLGMIQEGNRDAGGLREVKRAVGILGFIRFLNGYYLVLVTKAKQLGAIGKHKIFTIEEVSHHYIPFEKPNTALPEVRYKDLFFGLDMTRDFYFSYTYDLSNTLQHNMNPQNHHPRHFPYYRDMVVWNRFLLKPLETEEAEFSQWHLPIIHGYFIQTRMDVYGSSIEVSLISRRSSYFAGTRYLKRGMNQQGYVANDVETEQIICEPNTGRCLNEHYSAFVQHRGSIPLFWSQDNTGGVPKPHIDLIREDPFHTATILHFKDLFERYSHPIIVLNLVRAQEKRPRESLLGEGFKQAISFINGTIKDTEKQITYIPWDFKTQGKDKEKGLSELSKISQNAIDRIGFFHSSKRVASTNLREQRDSRAQVTKGGLPYDKNHDKGREQVGVVRTNCIDSLDRTNAAQYCVGQCALGHQLYALGLTSFPQHSFDSQISKLLMSMYEKSGNQLALQYGGSGLAHTLGTYNTTNVLDVWTSVKRYYNNVFSDYEKQMCINLFLGVFEPYNHKTLLMNTDQQQSADKSPGEKRTADLKTSDRRATIHAPNDKKSNTLPSPAPEKRTTLAPPALDKSRSTTPTGRMGDSTRRHTRGSRDTRDEDKPEVPLRVANDEAENRLINLWELHTDYFMHMKPNHEILICNLDWWKDSVELSTLQGQVAPHPPGALPPTQKAATFKNLQEEDQNKQYNEFYDVHTITEFDSELALPFNDVLRQTTDQQQPGTSVEQVALASTIGQWFAFATVGAKPAEKKKSRRKNSKPKEQLDQLWKDRPYDPLKDNYGMKIQTRKAELEPYLDVPKLGVTTSDTKPVYSEYMHTTHGPRPSLITNNKKAAGTVEADFENYFKKLDVFHKEKVFMAEKDSQLRQMYQNFDMVL